MTFVLSCFLFSISDLAHDADLTLFYNIIKKQHSLNVILPGIKIISLNLKQKGLPRRSLELHRRSFYNLTSMFAYNLHCGSYFYHFITDFITDL